MTQTEYGITKNLGQVEFDQAVERVTEALKTEGFGVLTEIDVKATLKKKLDVDIRKYKILGACNPPLAHKALQNEPFIGLLLPCNVVVFEEEDGTVTASAVDPKEMFKVVQHQELGAVAETVAEKLKRAVDAF
jgi:uncharacterized protein (DUF302 family)